MEALNNIVYIFALVYIITKEMFNIFMKISDENLKAITCQFINIFRFSKSLFHAKFNKKAQLKYLLN